MLIQVMKEQPHLLKNPFGMETHKAALKKIKGTHWQEHFFGSRCPAALEREIDQSRAKFDAEQLRAMADGRSYWRIDGDYVQFVEASLSDEQFDALRVRSESFIDDVKAKRGPA